MKIELTANWPPSAFGKELNGDPIIAHILFTIRTELLDHSVAQRWETLSHSGGQVRINLGREDAFIVTSFRDNLSQRIDKQAVSAVAMIALRAGTVAGEEISQVLVGPGTVEQDP